MCTWRNKLAAGFGHFQPFGTLSVFSIANSVPKVNMQGQLRMRVNKLITTEKVMTVREQLWCHAYDKVCHSWGAKSLPNRAVQYCSRRRLKCLVSMSALPRSPWIFPMEIFVYWFYMTLSAVSLIRNALRVWQCYVLRKSLLWNLSWPNSTENFSLNDSYVWRQQPLRSPGRSRYCRKCT